MFIRFHGATPRYNRHLFAVAMFAAAVGGCAIDRPTIEGRVVGLASEAGYTGRSFADSVPEPMQTRITRNFDAAGDDRRPTASIDATGDRVFFPLERDRRSFATKSDFVRALVDTFGAVEEFVDESGQLMGARGSYVAHGSAFMDDPALGVRYRITDPVMAYFGGVDGNVEIGGDLVCLDGDGDCDGPRASYLEPLGMPTAPSHVNLCGGTGVCVQFHAFYNKVPGPFFWARHGSNVKFTTYSALPETQLWARGEIRASGVPYAMPLEYKVGEDSVETAVWCWGTDQCVEHQADRVCGWGRIVDPDVFGTDYTGNGPQGYYCPPIGS